MSTPILVTGATGQQGGAVVKALLEKSLAVRAITRRPDGDTADGFVLVEVNACGDISEIYLLPIAPLAKKKNMQWSGLIRRPRARNSLRQLACRSPAALTSPQRPARRSPSRTLLKGTGY